MTKEEMATQIQEIYDRFYDKFGPHDILIDKVEEEKLSKLSELSATKPKIFKEGHVFDEEKSVRWNREELERRKEELKNYRSRVGETEMIYNSVIMRAILDNLTSNFSLNEDQASVIYSKAYEDSHSSGYTAVMYTAEDLAEMYEQVREKE